MYKLLSVSNRNDVIYRVKPDPEHANRATIWFKNGFLYRGEMSAHQMHGQGSLYLGDGSYYSGTRPAPLTPGTFKKDFFTQGRWVHKSGLFFEGLFYKDRFQKGSFHFLEGDHFEGEWSVRTKKYFLKRGLYTYVDGRRVECIPGQNLYISSSLPETPRPLFKEERLKPKMKSLQDLELIDKLRSRPSMVSTGPNSKSPARAPSPVWLDPSLSRGKNGGDGLEHVEEFSTENMNISAIQINSINENNYVLSQFLENSNKAQSLYQWDGPPKHNSHVPPGKSEKEKKKIRQKVSGKIFFSDCSNGTSCLYVGDFKDPQNVSTENALIVGIGGFYQEFVNDSSHTALGGNKNKKLNLRKICQFSYSPRLRGAFFSEEEFEQGRKKASRTFYFDGTMLQLFHARRHVPPLLQAHLPPVNLDSAEGKTRPSENLESDSDSDEKAEMFALVTYPYEKQLISIFGLFKGNEKTFTLEGNALFNNSLKICRAQMSLNTSKKSRHFKIPAFAKVMTSVEAFFTQVQLSRMKVLLEKPDASKINGFHMYQTSSGKDYQGLFLNDHLILHKDQIEESSRPGPALKMDRRSLIPFDCYNCLGKPLEVSKGESLSVKQLLQMLETKLCKVCRTELIQGKESAPKYSSAEDQKQYAKKSIIFPNLSKQYGSGTNPKKYSDAHKMEKIDFPFEKPFSVDPSGYGLDEYMEENHKYGPMVSPNFFKGEISGGKKQGFIYENFEGDECYAGYYKNGFRQGFGQLYKYGKYYFEGLFRKGRKHGQGQICFRNGATFVCQFNNNFLIDPPEKSQTKSHWPRSRPTSANQPSISPSRSYVTDQSPSRRRRRSRNQQPARLSKPNPKNNVEFSRLQANSRAMMERKRRKNKPLNLFKEDLEKEQRGLNLTEWIDQTQEAIHKKKARKKVGWTAEQKELFDGKSDLDASDIEKSGLSRLDFEETKSGIFKSPNVQKKPVFLFEGQVSLNFKN